MTFGEALRAELINVVELNNKVFPLVAPKDTKAPYLVYRRGVTEYDKTLGGISRLKTNGIYELVLIADNYSDIERMSGSAVDKLVSFLGREVGDSDIKVRNITVKVIGDSYEPEIEKYRCDLEIKVNY
jgi:hypothetical protein